ncbi:hypothetical protein [Stappia phage SI01]|uniref:Uncharacterized protein n=1 Tax=Stappia phage SI01 TaxID=2847766 RepID=A0AAE7SSH7_9CAUD|nr:hypothetical protein [Stappia phage SI01]
MCFLYRTLNRIYPSLYTGSHTGYRYQSDLTDILE